MEEEHFRGRRERVCFGSCRTWGHLWHFADRWQWVSEDEKSLCLGAVGGSGSRCSGSG